MRREAAANEAVVVLLRGALWISDVIVPAHQCRCSSIGNEGCVTPTSPPIVPRVKATYLTKRQDEESH